ncbi:MAG TPA: response regulator [Phototrophicaceae bacterium]|nr:response regulator [Phototrophicaceae bacterium]
MGKPANQNGRSTFLIVDDDPAFVLIVEMVLKRAGYAVLSASNGEEALEMVQIHWPDVILMDDLLPLLAGSEVCYRLKQNPDTAQIPVILVSAGDRVRDADLMRAIGADYVLAKPFKLEDLVKISANLLR